MAVGHREAVVPRLKFKHRPPVQDLTDEDLVRSFQAGREAAFAVIVRRYQDRVHWFVERMIGSLESEDFTQEVFLRAYRALPGLRNGVTLRAWLLKIAHNLCITELKKRGRRGEHVSIEEEGEESLHRLLGDDTRRLEEEIEREEFRSTVRGLVARLPAPYREVLTLYYADEMKYEEIAEVMGLPLGTVKTHLHRARLRLRDLALAEMDASHLPESEDRR